MLILILYLLVGVLFGRWAYDTVLRQGWMFTVKGSKQPRRGTPQSVGLDLFAYRSYVIDARRTVLVDTGIVLSPPAGHFTMLVARSSLHKRGLMLANGVGIVDPDYCGRADTLKLAVRNFTDIATIVDGSQAIAQAVFIPYAPPTPRLVATVPSKDSRGGFGSTDTK